jgi:hypothetical protein
MASGGTPPAGGTSAAGNASGGGGSTAGGSGGSAGTPASGGSGGQAVGDGYGWSGVDHAPAAITECSCNIAADGSDTQRCVKVVNRCTEAIRFHAAGTDTPANTFAGQVDLAPGGCQSYVLTNFTSGRLWAETNCNGGQCDPGPYTLAEFTLSGFQNLDFYDLSLVDGFNVPMSIRPVDGTFTPGGGKYKCGTPICLYDLVNNCPADLLKNNAQAQPAVCQSACAKFGEDQYCCAGAFSGGPQQCPPSMYSQVFKMACPDAYSYAFDDQASTYTCAGNDLAPDYDIIFCQ